MTSTTDARKDALLRMAMEALTSTLREYDRNTCTHEETHRGGSIWTICDWCDAKWADDEGGFVPYTEPAGVTAGRDLIASIQAELSQSPAPVAVQPDMAQWPDQHNRGLLQAAKQALASLDRHAILPWGQPGYPAPTPGADLLYEARDYLRPAIEREQAWREVVPPLSASPEDKPK